MSIVTTEDFLVPDSGWSATIWGRIDQGRRELAAHLRKDVTVERFAELIGRAGPSLTAWKNGEARPKRDSLEALEKLFLGAGLSRFTARFLDYGPEVEKKRTFPPAATPERRLKTPSRKIRRVPDE